MSDSTIDAVIFDMGGVIVQLSSLADVLAGADIPLDEIWERWILSTSVKKFESGACTLDEFAAGLIEELQVALPPEELIERFTRFPQGLYPGAEALVREVGERYTTGVLSNTNELHWTTQPDHGTVQTLFDRTYLSYAMKLVKPERPIFDAAAADLGCAPERIFFIDDNQVNVDGAHAAGWRGGVAKGPAEARALLVAEGILG